MDDGAADVVMSWGVPPYHAQARCAAPQVYPLGVADVADLCGSARPRDNLVSANCRYPCAGAECGILRTLVISVAHRPAATKCVPALSASPRASVERRRVGLCERVLIPEGIRGALKELEWPPAFT
jgi:hypothetical protein